MTFCIHIIYIHFKIQRKLFQNSWGKCKKVLWLNMNSLVTKVKEDIFIHS